MLCVPATPSEHAVFEPKQAKGYSPIARKQVEVLAPDGTTCEHVKHRKAYEMIAEGTATWIGSNYKIIQKIDQRVLARGVCGFDTEWRVRRSGIYGPTVWQMETSL
jgi:hypothetical protein